MMGDWGHFSVVLAFVAIIMAMIGYVMAEKAQSASPKSEWIRFSMISYRVHALAIISAIGTLFWIIFTHHYEYQYAWKHSSNDLPLYFLVSCLWEGQEGSFLLWILCNALIGLILLKSRTGKQPISMAVYCLIQLCLVSMVLGTYVDEMRVGSSPFILLKNSIQSDIYRIDPDFIPMDGSGLNPLLQNIWMAIHPPVIFLSFALTGVPFCQTIGSLWTADFKHYVKATAPWVLATVGIMGAGIIMGAYWAYETLNFGGYWNWDPVENAVFIPWLVLIAASHGMVLYRRKHKGLALTMILVISGFLLVVYSTFLTRSGILGNASVHSFTDLGLSGQLLIFLIVFVALSATLFAIRSRQIREKEINAHVLSLDFWMIVGICVFCLSAFQVLLPTSIPVLNAILSNLGISKSFAPPADQVAFYSKFQVWFAVGFALLAGTGQLFYWHKINHTRKLEDAVIMPMAMTLIACAAIIYFGGTNNIGYICLLTAAVYLLIISLKLLIGLIRNAKRTSLGGLIAHVGMALMLIGFVYSAGHQRVLSQNITINLPESNLPTHAVQENLLISAYKAKTNHNITFDYHGQWLETHSGDKIRKSDVLIDLDSTRAMAKTSARTFDGKWLNTGDSIRINPENIYYQIELTAGDEQFTIMPRMQNNPNMGYVASPDILSSFSRDIYTHITNFPDPDKVKWDEPITHQVRLNETIMVKGLELQIRDVRIEPSPIGIPTHADDIPLEATVSIIDEGKTYESHPVYHINNQGMVRFFPDQIDALGVKVMLTKIDPINQLYDLSVITSQRDWITIKCIEMPFISLVWLGAIIITLGVGIAFYFRHKESRQPETEEELENVSLRELVTIINNKATINI